ncbi:TIGR01777 family oxidoreductase [Winogradskyella sp. UBA3174]|mgnify:CR=1 FL=1|uniref:TIGR01777 family oxidoreductase n=1 Tax=Winogradskyella sp. UBA3174 TaxID=1947785 RepID=UPI002600EBA2|nr:TIGR01777 family oxidoreductase [Winogradskyella sp. UBA3174]|tara:strand:+ start:7388 stop:8293 length:906 start_codon:yes stop_codon:yes gene_type:complete
METKTITIAGGSGFLGQVLTDYFTKLGHTIYILTRTPKQSNDIYWNAKDLDYWTKTLGETDVLINLTGKSVDCRYTEVNKKLIHDSRIDSTNVLGIAVNLCKNPPKVWLNMSTSTIYEVSYTKEMTEVNGNIGDDFSMNIAKSWEAAFNKTITPKTKHIILRTSIVLGKKGGALIPLKRLTQFGLGGKQWHGKQKVSWIHEIDFARAVSFLIDQNLEGTFNIVAPKPTTNTYLMLTFRKALNIPFGISHPKWLLKIGAKIIGTESELVLKSRNVIPKKLIDEGFYFKYNTIEKAIESLVKS